MSETFARRIAIMIPLVFVHRKPNKINLEVLLDTRLPTWICIASLLGSSLFFGRLAPHERLIIVVLLMNASADITGNLASELDNGNGIVYNILAPLEKVITFAVYGLNTITRKGRMINLIGIALVLLLSLFGFGLYPAFDFHFGIYIAAGLILAVASYFHLREMVNDRARFSGVVFAFSLANLIYYTLMVSALSAIPLALTISNDFAAQIYTGNDLAYSLWSLIILIGIAWTKIRT